MAGEWARITTTPPRQPHPPATSPPVRASRAGKRAPGATDPNTTTPGTLGILAGGEGLQPARGRSEEGPPLVIVHRDDVLGPGERAALHVRLEGARGHLHRGTELGVPSREAGRRVAQADAVVADEHLAAGPAAG